MQLKKSVRISSPSDLDAVVDFEQAPSVNVVLQYRTSRSR